MANEVTIKILDGLIDDQKKHKKNRQEAIKDNEIRLSRLEADIETAAEQICRCDETIGILRESIETYRSQHTIYADATNVKVSHIMRL